MTQEGGEQLGVKKVFKIHIRDKIRVEDSVSDPNSYDP